MSDGPVSGYRARLRLHANTYLTDDSNQPSVAIGGHTVTVNPPQDAPTLNSTRVILNARELPSEEYAKAFGKRLKKAIICAAAMRQLGLDLGEDKATSSLAETIKANIKLKFNATIRNDVHGLDVFYDDGTVQYIGMSGKGTVSTPARMFFAEVATVFDWVEEVPPKLLVAAQLLNGADYAGIPIVQLALSCSAIETMAPELTLSENGMTLICDLIRAVTANAETSNFERKQIIQSLARIRDFGPSTGERIRALLAEFDMEARWKDLSRIYKIRAKILHGAYVPRDRLQDAAVKSRQASRDLFLAALKHQRL